jgi:3-oxoacyl-[acyl-carrier-protein] synthase II
MEHHITGHLECTSSASASGGIAIGQAFRLIKHGYQDVVIAGGVDFNLNRHFFEGMELFGASCNQFNHDPTRASMPYDERRCGAVMSDGGAVVVL